MTANRPCGCMCGLTSALSGALTAASKTRRQTQSIRASARTRGQPSRPLENQAEIIRWHFDDLGQHESQGSSSLGHRLKVAKTPLGIVRTKIRIKLLIT